MILDNSQKKKAKFKCAICKAQHLNLASAVTSEYYTYLYRTYIPNHLAVPRGHEIKFNHTERS